MAVVEDFVPTSDGRQRQSRTEKKPLLQQIETACNTLQQPATRAASEPELKQFETACNNSGLENRPKLVEEHKECRTPMAVFIDVWLEFLGFALLAKTEKAFNICSTADFAPISSGLFEVPRFTVLRPSY